jgi:hypothetical protein
MPKIAEMRGPNPVRPDYGPARLLQKSVIPQRLARLAIMEI